MKTRRLLSAAAAAMLMLPLTGCGSDDSASAADDSSQMSGMDDGGGMDMSEMNEPDATPAYEVDGEVKTGNFAVLDTAPPGSEEVTGQAWLAQTDDGTTVTIRFAGLEPDVDYVSHLHDQLCEVDNGGEHFKFDADGSDLPPNEIHLGFTAASDGSGEATVTNDTRVEDGAPAIVVHPADSMDNRLACADFS